MRVSRLFIPVALRVLRFFALARVHHGKLTTYCERPSIIRCRNRRKAVAEKNDKNKALDVRACPRCEFTNDYNAECCDRCGTLLEQKAVILSDSDEEQFLTKLFTVLVEDVEIKKKIGFLLNKTGLGSKLLGIIKTKI